MFCDSVMTGRISGRFRMPCYQRWKKILRSNEQSEMFLVPPMLLTVTRSKERIRKDAEIFLISLHKTPSDSINFEEFKQVSQQESHVIADLPC